MTASDSSAPHFDFERQGPWPVCGIDEAGRGPWAGPVVAAAVILDKRKIPKGLDDSKKLTAAKREEAFERIMETARIGVGVVEVDVIDQVNILNATFAAMAKALAVIGPVGIALVDGNRAPPLPCPVRTIIGGDGLSLSIAAASIIAKVTRDRIMTTIDVECPGYGFAAHKGYGTSVHAEALTRLGPSRHHRRSFAPVRISLGEIAAN